MHRSKRGHENKRRRRVQGAGGPEHVQAIAPAHLEVAEDHVELPTVQLLDRSVPTGGIFHVVADVGQRAHHAPAQGIVVVGHQYSPLRHGSPSVRSLLLIRSRIAFSEWILHLASFINTREAFPASRTNRLELSRLGLPRWAAPLGNSSAAAAGLNVDPAVVRIDDSYERSPVPTPILAAWS